MLTTLICSSHTAVFIIICFKNLPFPRSKIFEGVKGETFYKKFPLISLNNIP